MHLKQRFTGRAPLLTVSALGMLAAVGYTPGVFAGVGEIVFEECADGQVQCSRVDTEIVDLSIATGDGTRDGYERYEYTVNNTSYGGQVATVGTFLTEPVGPGPGDGPLLVDWELPWFANGSVDQSTIMSPAGWMHAIEDVGQANPERAWGGEAAWTDSSTDMWKFLNDMAPDGSFLDNGLTTAQEQAFLGAEQVLHWYIAPDFWTSTACGPGSGITVSSNNENGDCSWGWNTDGSGNFPNLTAAILPFGSQDEFSFEAPVSDALAAPYAASWFELPPRPGDPPTPGDPATATGALPMSALGPTSVPEPSALGLAGLGLLAAVAAVRRRRTTGAAA